MFRLFAIAAVVVAFGATLYYSGDTLEAWESPEPTAEAAPAKKKKAGKRHQSRKVRKAKAAPSVPRWIIRFEALCRRGEAQSEAIRPPSGPGDIVRYLDKYAQLNERWNRKAVALLRSSPGRAKPNVKRLLPLFDQEEALVQSMLTAVRNGQVGRLGGISKALLRVAKSENRLLIKMDAIACTVSPDVFQL
jgi:hypothetical protein